MMCSIRYEDQGNQCIPPWSINLRLISTLVSSIISPYPCLQQPLCSVYLVIGACQWRIADKATLRGVNEMIGIGWLLYQPSHAFDDVSTPVFYWALMIVIPSHNLGSVLFPLPESLTICIASNSLQDRFLVFEALETHRGVFFFQHIVIVHIHALLLGSTGHVFVLFTSHERVVENGL